MAETPNGLAIAFPIKPGRGEGNIFGFVTDTKEFIKSKIALLLSVERGERLFYANYGSDLKKILFDPNDDTTENEIFNEVKRSVEDNFSLVTVSKVSAEQDGNAALLKVNFAYQEGALTISDSLTFRFE